MSKTAGQPDSMRMDPFALWSRASGRWFTGFPEETGKKPTRNRDKTGKKRICPVVNIKAAFSPILG